MLDESTFLAKGGDLAAGATETMTADPTPGEYELVCHLTGHYAGGRSSHSRSSDRGGQRGGLGGGVRTDAALAVGPSCSHRWRIA